MELPLATQQPAIFLNQILVTPCWTPVVSHCTEIKSRLLTIIYKGADDLAPVTFLYLHPYLHYTPDLSFSGPLASGPLYFVLENYVPLATLCLLNFFSSAHAHFSQISAGLFLILQISVQMTAPLSGLPWPSWPKQKPHSLFWHGLIFSSSKPLSVSEINLFDHRCTIDLNLPEHKLYEFKDTISFITGA